VTNCIKVFERIRGLRARDEGVAMVTVLLVGVMLLGIGVAAAGMSIANLRNAGRDRVAGSAMGSAEAGIADAISYLRTASATSLNCSPGCSSNPWGNETTPQAVTYPDGGSAEVYITVDQAFAPPTSMSAVFTIHSDGTAGSGPGRRILEQTVTAEPLSFPIGVYANEIALNGTPQTFQESVFSKECISGRNKMVFDGTDIYHGIPASAHSAKWISEKNSPCDPDENDNIHEDDACNSAYPYDQDAQGGPTTDPDCAGVPGGTSYFDQAALDTYGRPLNANELAVLRATAQSQGQYYQNTTAVTPPDPSVYPNAVLFFDVGPDQTVSIQNELDAYDWDGDCANPVRTLVIVVNNSSVGSGGLKLNANADLAGAMFVQTGNLAFNGTATWTGTMFSNTISQWNGNATSQLTACFLQNLPAGLMSVTTTTFRELDR